MMFTNHLIKGTRSKLPDISKAFDKVWHEGIIFKSKQNVISGNKVELLADFGPKGQKAEGCFERASL